MTFDEWLEQANESDLRKASQFLHHYPIEISVMEVDMDNLPDSTSVEDVLEMLKSPKEWPHKTVCGCNPIGQHEFGSEDHRPHDWEELNESTIDMDELAEWLGHDIPE